MPARSPLRYPPGQQPDLWRPDPEHPDHRFVLGRVGGGVTGAAPAANPLVTVAMNPSYADCSEADRTVLRLVAASEALGHDGWILLNLYPERATSPRDLRPFDEGLWRANLAAIDEVLQRFGVREVLGAWGNPPTATIRRARALLVPALAERGVRVFCFGELTAQGEPRHPMQRTSAWRVDGERRYLA